MATTGKGDVGISEVALPNLLVMITEEQPRMYGKTSEAGGWGKILQHALARLSFFSPFIVCNP